MVMMQGAGVPSCAPEMTIAEAAPLPQPSLSADQQPWRYIRIEDADQEILNGVTDHDNDTQVSLFAPGQLVWVCKGKGLRKNTPANDKPDDKEASAQQRSAHKLFLRARVIGPDNDDSSGCSHAADHRIRVQYPKGSSYACQPIHLLPVLEHARRIILVAAETPEYRLACVVHTLPHESFLEVGCDFGITTDRVYQTLEHSCEEKDCENSRVTPLSPSRVWGIDKSVESIAIARQRYPHLSLFVLDVLSTPFSEWPAELQQAKPNVIAVDINGNRELEAVCQCLTVLFQVYQPRLILVKSRALHAAIQP